MGKVQKKYVKKVIDAVIISIFLVLVICLAWVFGQIVTGNPPSLFGYNAYTVVTNSMEPTIMTKDVIIAKKIKDVNQLEVGQIVTFIAPKGFANQPSLEGRYITHRIQEISIDENGNGYVITKGDNPSATEDIPIPVENVVAIFCTNSGFMKGLITVISNPFGFLAIVIVPLVGVLISQVILLVKASKKKSDSKEQLDGTDSKVLSEEELLNLAKQEALDEYNKLLNTSAESVLDNTENKGESEQDLSGEAVVENEEIGD